MANTNSNLAASAVSVVTDPTVTTKGVDLGGIMLFARGKVTCPATPSTSDTLTLLAAGQVPVGAIFEPCSSWVYCETDPGTALTIDIGTTDDTDNLARGLALTVAGTSSGRKSFDASGTMPVGISTPYTLASPKAVVATVTTSTAVDATVIQFCIAYRVTA